MAALLLCGCDLQERADYLLGRPCLPDEPACDEGQVCLPHARTSDGRFEDFFCRSEVSFDPNFEPPLPLAFCDPDRGLECPGAIVCNADRVRLDGGARPLVCKPADDPFAPPPPDSEDDP